MTISILLACIWAVIATVISFTRGRYHWPAAYVLIAIGIPLLGYVTYENGPLVGVVVLLGGVSMLRWPVIYLGRWLRRVFARRVK